MRTKTIHKTMTRMKLAQLFHKNGYTVGAEIGVREGLFSEVICKMNPGVDMYCVDVWRDRAIAEECARRLSPYDVRYMHMTSVEACATFEDGELDFVYIDANHSYASAREDITIWAPKVRIGGIVSGHDYKDRSKNMMVKSAVDIYVSENDIKDLHITMGEPDYSWFWNVG